ncbi:MAG: TetR/AcrR family transcriptional regulator [Eubacteriales bacterium]|nr:TetR/AcrR family transcriptional regulator [Eubacteriales bacterium]
MLQNILFVYIVAIVRSIARIKKAFLFHTGHFGKNVRKERAVMDRRQQKTRRAIFEAFGSLLERKNFGNITVQEIIDGANVGRSTFYAHFETKEDLLKAMCTDIFQHVFSEDLKKESSHDFSHTDYNFEKEITHILYHLQDNRRNLKGLFSCESGELFMRYFKGYLQEMFLAHIDGTRCQAPAEYVLNMTVCSFAETVRWWIAEEKEYTPEKITACFMEFINGTKAGKIVS